MGEVVSRRTSEPRAVSRRFISLHMEWRNCDISIVIFGIRKSRELKLDLIQYTRPRGRGSCRSSVYSYVEKKLISPNTIVFKNSLTERASYLKHNSSILYKTFEPLQSGYVREKDIHAYPSEPQNQPRFEELLKHLRMPLITRAP